jgi:hypothetical protein
MTVRRLDTARFSVDSGRVAVVQETLRFSVRLVGRTASAPAAKRRSGAADPRRIEASLDVSADGHIFVGESDAYEQFDQDLRRIWTRKSSSRVTCVEQLASGEILLCEPDRHRVSIVDAGGMVTWSRDGLESGWRAVYLQ